MGRLTSTCSRCLVASTLACFVLATVGLASPAAAGELVFHLFGSRTAGWGLTNNTLSIPGPSMDVRVGDNVTLFLTSLDGLIHSWFIDYDNDSLRDSTEPRSSFFSSRTAPVRWNFTVSNVTGTFPYRSDRGSQDLSSMWGNITISEAASGSPLGSGIILAGIAVLAIASVIVYFFRRSRFPRPPPPND